MNNSEVDILVNQIKEVEQEIKKLTSARYKFKVFLISVVSFFVISGIMAGFLSGSQFDFMVTVVLLGLYLFGDTRKEKVFQLRNEGEELKQELSLAKGETPESREYLDLNGRPIPQHVLSHATQVSEVEEVFLYYKCYFSLLKAGLLVPGLAFLVSFILKVKSESVPFGISYLVVAGLSVAYLWTYGFIRKKIKEHMTSIAEKFEQKKAEIRQQEASAV